jgi:hypothetical protein
VETITLKALLLPGALARLLPLHYHFCRTPACPVVYFANDAESIYHKEDLKVRVGLKEEEDPIPVCYCFGHTRASIRDEIERTGGTTVVEAISAHVRAGRCACEVNNPSGTCCLGEVSRAVKDLLRHNAGQSEGSAASGTGCCCHGSCDR